MFGLLVPPASMSSQVPESDIWLVSVSARPDGSLAFGEPRNVTRRPGYDNQPRFTPDGSGFWFTSYDDHTGQSDIWRYDIAPGTVARIVASNPESEYSAAPLPDGSGISVVRVEADSTQRLWRFGLRGEGGSPLFPDLAPVGYHVWADDSTVALYHLAALPWCPQPVSCPTTRTLVVGRASGGGPGRVEPEALASDIGRSLQRIPGSTRISFVQHGEGGERTIVALDPRTKELEPLAPALERSYGDHAWTPGGVLLQGRGSALYGWAPDQGEDWRELVDFGASGPGNITRLAASPAGDLIAMVDLIVPDRRP